MIIRWSAKCIALICLCLGGSVDHLICDFREPNIILYLALSRKRACSAWIFCLRCYLTLVSRQSFYFLHVSKLRHFVLGKIANCHIFCSGRRNISLDFQDTEGVESAVLKLVGLESMVVAGLCNIPSHGRKYRGAVPWDRR